MQEDMICAGYEVEKEGEKMGILAVGYQKGVL
jgi:hypothetical protein